jgi:hypothetical protein
MDDSQRATYQSIKIKAQAILTQSNTAHCKANTSPESNKTKSVLYLLLLPPTQQNQQGLPRENINNP